MTTTPIADQVAVMHAGRPADDPWLTEQRELARREDAAVAVAVGDPFPDGDLLDPSGAATSLTAARTGRSAVVVFYRGAWCPYCNLTLATYRDALASDLEERGVVLVAISPQAPDGSLTMREKHDLPFLVLSDPGNQIAGALGILTTPSPSSRRAQLEHGLDLTTVNADGTTTIPLPTVVVVASDGTLAWADVHPDYSTRTEPQQVLDGLGL